jgi:hypothetical protein
MIRKEKSKLKRNESFLVGFPVVREVELLREQPLDAVRLVDDTLKVLPGYLEGVRLNVQGRVSYRGVRFE